VFRCTNVCTEFKFYPLRIHVLREYVTAVQIRSRVFFDWQYRRRSWFWSCSLEMRAKHYSITRYDTPRELFIGVSRLRIVNSGINIAFIAVPRTTVQIGAACRCPSLVSSQSRDSPVRQDFVRRLVRTTRVPYNKTCLTRRSRDLANGLTKFSSPVRSNRLTEVARSNVCFRTRTFVRKYFVCPARNAFPVQTRGTFVFKHGIGHVIATRHGVRRIPPFLKLWVARSFLII